MVTEGLAGTKRLALLGVLTALCVVLRIFNLRRAEKGTGRHAG